MPRPVQHPASEDISISAVLYALSDPVRAAIVRELTKAPQGLNCTEMNQRLGLKLAKSTCSQHYRILREAGVIFSERKGVELFSRVRTQELSAKFPGLLRSILNGYAVNATPVGASVGR
jgi:DNA-binding transcriptional ArsR family regulator